MLFPLHEPPQPLQGKLDMPPRCTACPADMYSGHSLRLAQEVVTANFFLCLPQQSGERSCKWQVARY